MPDRMVETDIFLPPGTYTQARLEAIFHRAGLEIDLSHLFSFYPAQTIDIKPMEFDVHA